MKPKHELDRGRRQRRSQPRATVYPRSVLVPINFSAESRNALKYAETLARPGRALLVLLHVVEPEIQQFDFGYGDVTRQSPNLDTLKNARVKLDALTKRLAGNDPQPLGLVRVGAVQAGILGAARDLRTDLIVIGVGGTGVPCKDSGGTVEAIVRNAPCPVLVVRNRASAPHPVQTNRHL
ncbi:MAG: hypothetical protein C5B50_23045 [Verrucomicrobia bacterium]|nr:MAG: hypothetical protein C5B50_23045 [Verrucomicrobiota bacterium]